MIKHVVNCDECINKINLDLLISLIAGIQITLFVDLRKTRQLDAVSGLTYKPPNLSTQ